MFLRVDVLLGSDAESTIVEERDSVGSWAEDDWADI